MGTTSKTIIRSRWDFGSIKTDYRTHATICCDKEGYPSGIGKLLHEWLKESGNQRLHGEFAAYLVCRLNALNYEPVIEVSKEDVHQDKDFTYLLDYTLIGKSTLNITVFNYKGKPLFEGDLEKFGQALKGEGSEQLLASYG